MRRSIWNVSQYVNNYFGYEPFYFHREPPAGIEPALSGLEHLGPPRRGHAEIWWQEDELNIRRAGFQAAALPLSYLAIGAAARTRTSVLGFGRPRSFQLSYGGTVLVTPRRLELRLPT
jgi:hypothetical protein